MSWYVEKYPEKFPKEYLTTAFFLEKVGDRIWNRYQEVYIPILEKADEVLPDFFDPVLDAGKGFLFSLAFTKYPKICIYLF